MGFRNPLRSVSADRVDSGRFRGNYELTGLLALFDEANPDARIVLDPFLEDFGIAALGFYVAAGQLLPGGISAGTDVDGDPVLQFLSGQETAGSPAAGAMVLAKQQFTLGADVALFAPRHRGAQDQSGSAIATTNVSYEYPAGFPTVDVVAPASGQVLVIISSQIRNSLAAGGSRMSFQVRLTNLPFTEFQAPLTSTSILVGGTDDITACRAVLVFGLTPGVTYEVRGAFRVSSGTGTFNNPSVVVLPMP